MATSSSLTDATDPTSHTKERPYLSSSFRNLPPDLVNMFLAWLHHSLERNFHRRGHFSLKHLLLVSKDWKYVVENTPAVWTTIRVMPPRYGRWQKRIELHLKRSANLPLTIIFEKRYSQDALPILEAHRSRWQELMFLSAKKSPQLADPRPFLSMALPELRTLEFAAEYLDDYRGIVVDAPALQTLICMNQAVELKEGTHPPIKSLTLIWAEPLDMSKLSLLKVLSFQKTLQEFRLSISAGMNDPGWETHQFPMHRPELPALRILVIDRWGPAPSLFLDRVHFPNLYHLEIRTGGDSLPEGGLPILSSVHTLVWEEDYGTSSLNALKRLLIACPNILHLHVLNRKGDSDKVLLPDHPRSEAISALCVRLPNGALEYCAQLQHLRLHQALVAELEELTGMRPLLERVVLDACRDADYTIEGEKFCVRPGTTGILTLVNSRVQLTLPLCPKIPTSTLLPLNSP